MTLTSPGVAAQHRVVLEEVGHRLDRAEVVGGHEVDVGARFFAARKKLRPMRPKPLMPTRTVMSPQHLSVVL